MLKVNRAKSFEALLRVVLSLHRKRILSRLKENRDSLSGKTKGRRSFLKTWRKPTGLRRDSPGYEIRCREIIAWFNDLNRRSNLLENTSAEQVSSGTADNHILHLIEDVDSFFEIHEADLLLTPIQIKLTNQVVNALLSMRKLRRYVKVCNGLLTAARRYSIFSRITTCFVDLQQFRYGRSLPNPRSPSAAVSDTLVPPETVIRLAQLDKKTPSIITTSLSERLRHGTRLHPEIQLLIYYELHPTASPPRMISSSKNSCYLCKLFFKFHGKFAVPRSHGHMDDDWKWPAPVRQLRAADARVGNLDYLLPAFMAAVEERITDCLERNEGKKGEVFGSLVSVDFLCASSLSSFSAVSNHEPQAAQYDQSLTDRAKIPPSIKRVRASPKPTTPAKKPRRIKEKGMLFGIPIIDATRGREDAHDSKLDTKLRYRPNPEKPSKRTDRQDSMGGSSWLPEKQKSQRTSGDYQDNRTLEKRRHRRSRNSPPILIEKQAPPIVLQKGVVGQYSFNTKETNVRIWTSKLHLHLEISAPKAPRSSARNDRERRRSKGMQLEIQWLDSNSQVRDMNAFVVDVKDLSREGLPEDVLFSNSGLIIRQKETLIQMRAFSL